VSRRARFDQTCPVEPCQGVTDRGDPVVVRRSAGCSSQGLGQLLSRERLARQRVEQGQRGEVQEVYFARKRTEDHALGFVGPVPHLQLRVSKLPAHGTMRGAGGGLHDDDAARAGDLHQ
jgi:hypothetical protein